MAKKPTSRPAPTRESEALDAALAKRGRSANRQLAALLDMEPSVVSQWRTARRPVPARLAEIVADFAGVRPDQISRAYAEMAAAQLRLAVGEPRAAYAAADEVAADQIREIHSVLAALVAAMVKHRPAEAADVASALWRMAPAHLLEKGLIPELLATLDAAGRRKAKA